MLNIYEFSEFKFERSISLFSFFEPVSPVPLSQVLPVFTLKVCSIPYTLIRKPSAVCICVIVCCVFYQWGLIIRFHRCHPMPKKPGRHQHFLGTGAAWGLWIKHLSRLRGTTNIPSKVLEKGLKRHLCSYFSLSTALHFVVSLSLVLSFLKNDKVYHGLKNHDQSALANKEIQ